MAALKQIPKNRFIHHKELFLSGRWEKMPFFEQMANIGSEVYRAISWKSKAKNDTDMETARLAFYRSLELFDYTMACKLTYGQLSEVCRLRELWVDFFAYDNVYKSDAKFFNNYFAQMTIAYQNTKNQGTGRAKSQP